MSQAAGYTALGIYPSSNHTKMTGHDFVYDWQKVQDAAREANQNLDCYLCLPIGARLAEKKPETPVTFWFAPMSQYFVVTVCSTKEVDFMNPLHGLKGYVQYGANYLRHDARPFLHYQDGCIIRVHMLDAQSYAQYLVADYGNASGLTVERTDERQFNEIGQSPLDHYEYSAVHSGYEDHVSWNDQDYIVRQEMCVPG